MFKNFPVNFFKISNQISRIEFDSVVTNALILLQPEVENNFRGSGPNGIICNMLLQKII